MSADLVLFAIDPYDVDMRAIKARLDSATAICDDPEPREISWEEWRSGIERLYANPHVEVGQVSWLKAWMGGSYDAYVPGPIERCLDLVGAGVLLTPGMAKAITVAFNQPNRSIYGHVAYARVRDDEHLARLRREASKGCRRSPWSAGTLRHPDIAVYRKGRGIASGRFVKRFLQANLGAWLTTQSA
jgi:hypothetical protein